MIRKFAMFSALSAALMSAAAFGAPTQQPKPYRPRVDFNKPVLVAPVLCPHCQTTATCLPGGKCGWSEKPVPKEEKHEYALSKEELIRA